MDRTGVNHFDVPCPTCGSPAGEECIEPGYSHIIVDDGHYARWRDAAKHKEEPEDTDN